MSEPVKKPIFRWAGGKSWLLKYLYKFLPDEYKNYHEPFLGGASIFIHLRPERMSYLSDINADLINAYCEIQNNVEEVISILKQFRNTEKEYYRIRDINFHKSVEKAAQFIFLNRTSFNGIYRVNLNGNYNVPYGFKKYKKLFDFGKFREASVLLKEAQLSCFDFNNSLKYVNEGDLIFLDPPYTESPIKNGFIKYNHTLFSWDDQIRLASFIEKVIRKKAFFILTNAKHEAVKDLFGRFCSPISIRRANVIGGKNAKRGVIEEYIFTNTI